MLFLSQVLYHMFETYSEMGTSRITYTEILSGFASFIVVAIGGTVIGVVWGFATGFVTRFTYQVRVIEPIFIFVMAYLAYLNAEIFHMSGILAYAKQTFNFTANLPQPSNQNVSFEQNNFSILPQTSKQNVLFKKNNFAVLPQIYRNLQNLMFRLNKTTLQFYRKF